MHLKPRSDGCVQLIRNAGEMVFVRSSYDNIISSGIYAWPSIEISWTGAVEICQESFSKDFSALMGASQSPSKEKELGSLNARDFLVQSRRFDFYLGKRNK